MIDKKGDFSKINEKFKTNSIKCFVKEANPRFLISDGSFFMSAYFTKEALENYEKQKFPIKISDLADKVIVISKWHLEFSFVDNVEVFTSYCGIEMKLIIKDFKVKVEDKVHLNKYPSNLYRD